MERSTASTVAERLQRLDLDHLEVLGRQAHGHARAAAAHRVVHRGREVQVERVAVLVGLRRLLAVVPGAGAQRRVVADAVLVDLAEEVGQRLLAQAAHALGRQLDAPALLLDQPGVGQRLGQVGQAVERPGRVLAHVLAHLVQVDLAQRGRRRGRLEHLLHAVELAQLGGQVGGLAHAHGALAVEVVGLLPAGVGHGALEVLGQALDLPAQVHVLEHRVHQAAQLGLLLGAHGVPHRLGGGHALGQLLQQLVEVLRVAREHVAELRHELLEAGVEVVAALALLEHGVRARRRRRACAAICSGSMLDSASEAPSKKVSAISRRSSSTSSSKRSRASEETKS